MVHSISLRTNPCPDGNEGRAAVATVRRKPLTAEERFKRAEEHFWAVKREIQKLRPRYLEKARETRLTGKPNPHAKKMDSLRKRLDRLAKKIGEKPTASLVGFIYVVGFGPYVKIGWTRNENSGRLKALQTGAPEPLITYAMLPAIIPEERQLHARFAALRLQGEWFRKEGEVAEWIEEGCLI